MPRVTGISGPYRFFFTSFDCGEPPHVHVERDDKIGKFWLQPLGIARSYGFNARELSRIRRLIASHLPVILKAWYEHCGSRK